MNVLMGELDTFGLLVACLCHDLDHRGTNNAFQLKYEPNYIAFLYIILFLLVAAVLTQVQSSIADKYRSQLSDLKSLHVCSLETSTKYVTRSKSRKLSN